MQAPNPSNPAVRASVTLQDVFDRVSGHAELSDMRKRDLRSSVATYGKIIDRSLGEIPLDLAAIRKTLDGVVPLQAKVSRKRWTNLRSDLAAAIAESELIPMLKTSELKLDKDWEKLFSATTDRRITNGLSRFGRWASLTSIHPADVSDAVFARFFAELEAKSLVRHLSFQRRNVPRLWKRLVGTCADLKLTSVDMPAKAVSSHRRAWNDLPKSFRNETEEHLTWCTMPDPLDENARTRALAPRTVQLRRHYIQLAVTAACEAGVKITSLTSLKTLVEPEFFKAVLRQQWQKNGSKPTAHLLGLANDLIAIAKEWVNVSPDHLTELKKLRGKLGSLPRGLTEKNRSLLRRLEDPRLLGRLLNLPDRMWKRSQRNSPSSPYWFVHLQTALAIDILLHSPLRIEDLSSLSFEEHIHWPQGKGKPALISIRQAKVEDNDLLECELPAYLSDRLYKFRNDIALRVIGSRPEYLFVSPDGSRRAIATLRVAIQRAVLRHVGIKMSPHQFRHLAAMLHLDAYPNAHEAVRQFLGHRELKTTTRFYAGPNTRRAGKAHADLIRRLREPPPKSRYRNRHSGEWSIQ